MIPRLALLVPLAACAPAPSPDLAAAPSWRDPSVTVASKAAADPARLEGTWRASARLPVAFQSGCDAVAFAFGPRAGDALSIRATCDGVATQGTARLVAPGRLAVALPGLWRGPLWVLWADTGWRTMVLADPAGRAAWVLDRGATSPDRARAARDVLDFNGFDAKALIGAL